MVVVRQELFFFLKLLLQVRFQSCLSQSRLMWIQTIPLQRLHRRQSLLLVEN
jgi:hypothetical protein